MSSGSTVSQFARFVRRHAVVVGLIFVVIATGVVSLYRKPAEQSKPMTAKIEIDNDAPQLAKFVTHPAPKPVAALNVITADGAAASLEAMAGELLVVNFWATWCAPCRKEMPQLDALAARYDGRGVTVVALSLDRSGAAKGEKFLNELGVTNLVRLYDPSYKSARAVGLIGLPTTLLVDGAGREIGRLAGEADWDAPEVHALLDYYLDN
jgi:thiol-disulfide isomerase/thioredoxin